MALPKSRVRVLIVSANPERIMMVRESLHAWPQAAVCRVAVNRQDAIHQFESHAPHLICWDTAFGTDLPPLGEGVRALWLGEDACTVPQEPAWGTPLLSEEYVSGLQQSIDREYELRRLLVQLRDAHGTETQSRLLLNRATDGIVVVDRSHRVAYVNPAACAMLGVECDALLGEPFEPVIPEEGCPTTFVAQSSDGSVTQLTATAIVSIWDGHESIIIQLQPAVRPSVPPSMPPSSLPIVSGPRVSEDRLRTVGRLAAGLAHEVNNPLTFVLANLESLRESHHAVRRFLRRLRVTLATEDAITVSSFEQLEAEASLQELLDDAADMLTDCHKGMHRIQEIARSLGTFSRADDDHAERVDVTRIVDDACAMVFNQIRYRARLVKRFEPVPMIAAHPGRIAQALVNLLTNAAEAIEGGAYDQHRIIVSTRVEDGYLRIAVRDTGSGIREEDRNRIFTPGFTTKAPQGGMGLGLSVSKRVAEEHGGRLEVSHPERGTCVELVFPVETGLRVVEPTRESRPVSEAPARRWRLLIIDDDAMVLSALRRRLRRRFDVVTVLGGAEALVRLGEDPRFDALVCDLMMPEIDGKSFYDQVCEAHSALADRIVFMSGGAFTPRLRKFAGEVANPVLQKPVTREDLEAALAGLDQPRG